MTRALTFIDTETTDLGPHRAVWEVAAVRREPDGSEHKFEAFLSVDVAKANPVSLRIGGFFERHPFGLGQAGGSVSSKVKTVADITAASILAVLTHDATIVGACPWFDTETLAPLLIRCGFLPMWHHRLRDVESMAVLYLGTDDVGGLQGIATRLGIDVDETNKHTAMGDVRTTMAVYDRLLELAFDDTVQP